MKHHPKLIESFSRIVSHVGDEFMISPEEIVGKSRMHSIARARFVAISLCHRIHGLSLPEAAKLFGVTHQAIMHAIRCVEDRAKTEMGFVGRYNGLLQLLAPHLLTGN